MAIYALDGDRPELPEDGSAFVAPGAHVIGRVRLGADVGIWFGAVLRGDNEWMTIGEGSNVQDNCALHSDAGFPLTIGAGCTIGHSAIVHGCTIGDNSLIGMGATILNGARIGRNSIVGANALVTEGKEFPDNSLIVGSPAKVARTLDDGAAEKLRASAAHYVRNARRFAEGLERLDEAPAESAAKTVRTARA
ncbi:gamma carbonic anhydrase family protein [Aurantimonas endophytica]|uniref:Carbonic anhydrase/acetyltransferase-like protein (Isoleucine patch superfamily) n=1 Tax=Aurantimonas endophytica TaxID=1522175 RepID=A0A7W6HFM3_9HYPH|nr:gamma carbonic anhydrase family protein [Aurantimonas endophytica]MBB4004271.1 carbonic anhydrase/acetyltransferase-like protein (isoleucine patch superfamily) [Aurantimonas endophytica]MCO6405111.1 gamma carbonic anhydrase family protein [Aurantimonas endophytica]